MKKTPFQFNKIAHRSQAAKKAARSRKAMKLARSAAKERRVSGFELQSRLRAMDKPKPV